MGGFTCTCVKNENSSILLNEFVDKERIDPVVISLVKRIQTNWRVHYSKNQIKSAKSVPFSLEKLRPELKEILPEEFTLSLSPNVLNVQKLIGPFKIDPTEEANLAEMKLYKLNPILFQNNIIYVGTWNSSGQRHGVGIMYLPEGGVFEGFFKNDIMTGRGRLINSEGDIMKETLKMIKLMVTVNMFQEIMLFTKDIGRMINRKEEEKKHILIKAYI